METNQFPIQFLKKGEIGLVTEMVGEADEVQRMSALGIRTGVEVCGVRKGCTCIFKFGCSRMCLRTSGQLQILVSRIPTQPLN